MGEDKKQAWTRLNRALFTLETGQAALRHGVADFRSAIELLGSSLDQLQAAARAYHQELGNTKRQTVTLGRQSRTLATTMNDYLNGRTAALAMRQQPATDRLAG